MEFLQTRVNYPLTPSSSPLHWLRSAYRPPPHSRDSVSLTIKHSSLYKFHPYPLSEKNNNMLQSYKSLSHYPPIHCVTVRLFVFLQNISSGRPEKNKQFIICFNILSDVFILLDWKLITKRFKGKHTCVHWLAANGLMREISGDISNMKYGTISYKMTLHTTWNEFPPRLVYKMYRWAWHVWYFKRYIEDHLHHWGYTSYEGGWVPEGGEVGCYACNMILTTYSDNSCKQEEEKKGGGVILEYYS